MKSPMTLEGILGQINAISGMGFHLDLVLRKIQDAYIRKFEALEIDMTIEQWVILHQVHELGEDASQRDISKLNFRNRATISRVIGRLESKGWLQKSRFEGDLKQFKLELTTEGKGVVNLVKPHAIELRRQAVQNIEPTDFDTFMAVLERISQNYTAE